ncbi:MAG: 4-(cytidine 5'-diphospho)-2-C-methyl-D-erythritol kinase [Coriobacteriia bacterium]|nr:4-(cytidine 5'-diphospho)-2-C-methyl-D-erythritol kinase [Coriobacteriia bacterium]
MIDAPAKLNLYLAVGGRRPDGYHDVDTVLVSLELHDTVVVSAAPALSVVCTPDVGVPAEENLAYRAARALGEAVGRDPLVAIAIEKRIPSGAGLGGGSADAAAVIAALAALWDLAPDAPVLTRVAASLGADVPFLLRGGCALYAGRGDEYLRSLPVPDAHFVVVNPGVPVPTGAAYAAFDRMLRPAAPGVRFMGDALRIARTPAALGQALFNNMTEASTGLVPEIREALVSVAAAEGCLGSAMAGSGSSVFGVFEDEAAALAAATAAAERGWWSTATRARAAGTLAQTRGEQA